MKREKKRGLSEERDHVFRVKRIEMARVKGHVYRELFNDLFNVTREANAKITQVSATRRNGDSHTAL